MYKKVLVPLDGSKLAECALPYIKGMAKDGSLGEVVLLNVVVIDIPLNDIAADAVGYKNTFDYNDFREKFMNHSRKYLAGIQDSLVTEGIKVTSVSVEANRPAALIAEYAQQNAVDLIVVATHGYTGMKKMLLGSVSFKVMHISPSPVLLIRPESCHS